MCVYAGMAVWVYVDVCGCVVAFVVFLSLAGMRCGVYRGALCGNTGRDICRRLSLAGMRCGVYRGALCGNAVRDICRRLSLAGLRCGVYRGALCGNTDRDICRRLSLVVMRCGVYRGALQNIIANVDLFQQKFYVLIIQSVLLL